MYTNFEPGTLYLVATPIGNLADFSRRAIDTLESADRILAEDTRHSRKLLDHYGISRPMMSLHEHNENEAAAGLIELLRAGESLALVSDAGTPLISDPGYRLVVLAREQGIRVVPVPGACALITALSASGLPTDRFVFEGFLPAKSSARRARLQELLHEARTLVFYEASHRIRDSLADMAALFGAERRAVIARELTKRFETVHSGVLNELVVWIDADSSRQKGEFVVLVHGEQREAGDEVTERAEQVLGVLLEELPVRQAAKLAARLTGINKRALYRRGLEIQPPGKGRSSCDTGNVRTVSD